MMCQGCEAGEGHREEGGLEAGREKKGGRFRQVG